MKTVKAKKRVLSVRRCYVMWTPADTEDLDEDFKGRGPGTHPTAGQVLVQDAKAADGDWMYWQGPYLMAGGCCWVRWRDCPYVELQALLMTLFQTLVVRDGLDPMKVHEAFLQLKEYRETIANDCPGLPPCY